MTTALMATLPRTPCRIHAPARLHLGFLDPGASLGRRFGSIGLAIEALATIVTAVPHEQLLIEAVDDNGRIADVIERVLAHFRLPPQIKLTVEQLIPEHAGLRSGTQLALAVGTALTALHGRQASADELAGVLGRGRRSGIGIGLFDQGGLIVDAGHGKGTVTPPLISRLEFPADWRVVLVFDRASEGLSGGAELQAFAELEPMPMSAAAHLCHLTLMRLLPAVAERHFEPFASAVGEIQAIVGDHFAGVQCGRFTSTEVCRAITVLVERHALRGVGQSSWGPTGFAFAPDQGTAEAALESLRATFATVPQLEFMIVQARNRGAEVTPLLSAEPRRRAGG
jgi:beta-ribofuranosylaminobenzene 5'-phosphate synthase